MIDAIAASALIFPGQGSQEIGMGRLLAEAFPVARQIFAEADETLGFALSRLAWEGPPEALNDTLNTQPALLTHSVAAWRVFQQQFPEAQPRFVAGHSMGEISSLVAAEALSFGAALKLVRRRGELMKRAGEIAPGGMAAIMGLDIPALDQICAQASAQGEIVQVANDNCPGQVVISGARSALERALQLAQQAGARRVFPLAVSIPAHSPLMQPIQAEFKEALDQAPFVDPRVAIIGNVTATPLNTAAEIRNNLQAQLNARVRWTETIQKMIQAGVTTFLEPGSGSVLTGLLKRIDRQVNGYALGTPADFEKLAAVGKN